MYEIYFFSLQKEHQLTVSVSCMHENYSPSLILSDLFAHKDCNTKNALHKEITINLLANLLDIIC